MLALCVTVLIFIVYTKYFMSTKEKNEHFDKKLTKKM